MPRLGSTNRDHRGPGDASLQAAVDGRVWAAHLDARESERLLRAALSIVALIFVGSAIFGAYHAGIEWGFWPGPTECTGALDHAQSVEDFLQQLQSVKVTRCDVPALRILGLSLAGWNALISAGLAALAVVGARSRF